MPEIGRFTGVDPISDQYPHVSVYNYAENSPIGNIDLWGLQKVDANYVGIVGYGNQHSKADKNAFGQRLKGFGADQSFTVKTGKEFLKALVKASKDGPITRLVVGSHGSGNALFFNSNEGLYSGSAAMYIESAGDLGLPGDGAATLNDMADMIESGDIKFADDAQVFFVGCNTADDGLFMDSFAKNFSQAAPNTYVTGSTNKSSPTPTEDGKSDSNNYSSKGNSPWNTYKNGEVVNEQSGSVNPTTDKRP